MTQLIITVTIYLHRFIHSANLGNHRSDGPPMRRSGQLTLRPFRHCSTHTSSDNQVLQSLSSRSDWSAMAAMFRILFLLIGGEECKCVTMFVKGGEIADTLFSSILFFLFLLHLPGMPLTACRGD